MFADVLFPQKLPPMTYRILPGAPEDLVGRAVQVELRRRPAMGLVISTFPDQTVLEQAHGPLPKGVVIKPLLRIDEHIFTKAGQRLFQWLSDYYVTPQGITLKTCFFEDIVSPAKPVRKKKGSYPPVSEFSSPHIAVHGNNEHIMTIAQAIKDQLYRTWLYHAPLRSGPKPFITAILETIIAETTGIMILVPEFTLIKDYAGMIASASQDRLAVIHSKLSPNQRIHAVHRIRTGQADIVIGTRSAILVPMPRLSFIIVVDEHNSAYKAEEGMRYHGRDVAVMRGYFEKAAVLLTSSCPSIESSYNVQLGKYTLISHSQKADLTAERPSVHIVRPPAGRGVSERLLAPAIIKKVHACLKGNQSVLFLINRKGYSLLQCKDCTALVRCSVCGSPLVFHKSSNRMECRTCVTTSPVPLQCPDCKGIDLRPLGTGTERLRDALKDLFGVDTAIMEKNSPSPSDEQAFSALSPLVVGTDYAIHAGQQRRYHAAVILSLDAAFSQPDFRAHERIFQDICRLVQHLEPNSTMFIQTRNDHSPLVRAIARFDYDRFFNLELQQRQSICYPPFVRLLKIDVYTTQHAASVGQKLMTFCTQKSHPFVQVLGPLETQSDLKQFKWCWHMMVKSSERKLAADIARQILRLFEKDRHIRIITDVDP